MDLTNHSYFQSHRDSAEETTSFILNKQLAPIQQAFYFVNSSFSADEKYLWFYTSFPPGLQSSLGVVCLDPKEPFIHHFPEAQFSNESPLVLPEGDGVICCIGTAVWKFSLKEKPVCICSLPNDFLQNRHLFRFATHLTLSADGKRLLVDGEIGNTYFVGLIDLESGTFQLLKEFSRRDNHAQFSPVDPDLFLIAQDWGYDPISGRPFNFDHRTWLMDVEQTRFEPLQPNVWCGNKTTVLSHEWWAADGTVCWIDYERGAFEMDLADKKTVQVWKEPLCHAHCNEDRSLWCADQSPYQWNEKPCQVLFYNRLKQRRVVIAGALPQPPYPRSDYHIDPHPRFSPKGNWISYTTTINNSVNVALTSVEELKQKSNS